MKEELDPNKKTILVVDDEKPIIDILVYNLKKEGYNTLEATDGEMGINVALEARPDLILLDVMLPKVDGLTVCNKVKQVYNVPILMISARDEEVDKIVGLELGADDYITKPFEMVELLARVESVLRRYHKSEERIEVDDVIIDIPSRTVTRQGEAVKLTLKEFELLLFLVRNRNIALYRETIYENIWQSEYMGDGRTVDLHIQRLRKKLHWEDRIHTVYKVGYRFT